MKRYSAIAIVFGWVVAYSAGPASAADVHGGYEHTVESPSDASYEVWSPEDDSYAGEASAPHAFHHGTHGCCADETPLQRFRQSAYQGTTLSGGILGDGGDDALTISHYDVTARFAVPIDGMENVVLISPSFRQEIIDAPTGVDIPDSLYVTGVNFTWLKALTPRLKATTMVAPTIRSDFETSEDAVRIFGLGMLTYEYAPEVLDLSLGVVYLDRDDIPLLPVAGFTWTPSPLWQVDINFPRPRIARRIDKRGGVSESWVYTAVGLGGNTWAVERADGSDDVLTLRDYQWIFGWEHRRSGGRGLFVEAGAAFGRTLEYEETDEEVDFDDALFFRAGIGI